MRDAIRPDIRLFASCKIEKTDNRGIIIIEVQQGTDKPYYLTEKGLKPSGVYIRVESASAPVSRDAIRFMIKEMDGEKFENMRALNQELIFEVASLEFKKKSRTGNFSDEDAGNRRFRRTVYESEVAVVGAVSPYAENSHL